MSRRNRPLRSQPGLANYVGRDPEDERFEDVRRRRGPDAAAWILDLARRSPGMPRAVAWRWAEEKWDERELAHEAATGWDPDEEYRPHPRSEEQS